MNKRFTFTPDEIALVEQLVQAAKESDRAKFSLLCLNTPGTVEYRDLLTGLLDKLSRI